MDRIESYPKELVHVDSPTEMVDAIESGIGACFCWHDSYDEDDSNADRRLYFTVPSQFVRSGWESFFAVVRHGDPIGQVHGWDGNEDKPTIDPSLRCEIGSDIVWHGYIRSGRLQLKK